MTLAEVYNMHMKSLSQVMRDTHWEDRETYALFCRQICSWAVESSPLLAIAGARIQNLDIDNSLKLKLKSRFFKHTQEELGHEIDAVKDLNALDFQEKNLPVFAETKSMWASQYYVVQNLNPLYFFGYILMLEGLAVTEASNIAKRVEVQFPKANNFLKLHGDEDPDHIEKAFKSINSLPEEYHQGIFENFAFSVDCFKAIMIKVQKKEFFQEGSFNI